MQTVCPETTAARLQRLGQIESIGSSSGGFYPTSACPRPRMLLLLYGQLRTLRYTAANLERMAALSSKDCYFAVAVADHEYCEAHESLPGMCAPPRYGGNFALLNWSNFANSVIEMLRHTQKHTFHGRLAYTVARFARGFRLADKVAAYSSMLGEMLVTLLRQAPLNNTSADAIVVRSRFDASYSHYFDLDALRQRILQPAASRHFAVVVGQEYNTSQTDLHLMSTLATYRRLVAHDGQNAWGFGAHVANLASTERPPCMNALSAATVQHSSIPYEPPQSPQLACAVETGSCSVIVVESWRMERDQLVRDATRGIMPPPMLRWSFDRMRIYCQYHEALLKEANARNASFGWRTVHRCVNEAREEQCWLPKFLRSRQLRKLEWPDGCFRTL